VADQYELTNADWGKIHAKAWREPAFRELLETDPTTAIKQYVEKAHPGHATVKLRMVKLRDAPSDVPQQFWDDVNPFPPSCC
jgi:hypothetical protein